MDPRRPGDPLGRLAAAGHVDVVMGGDFFQGQSFVAASTPIPADDAQILGKVTAVLRSV